MFELSWANIKNLQGKYVRSSHQNSYSYKLVKHQLKSTLKPNYYWSPNREHQIAKNKSAKFYATSKYFEKIWLLNVKDRDTKMTS